jgi:hypothetical protein
MTKEEALKKIEELKSFIENEDKKERIIPNMLYYVWDYGEEIKQLEKLSTIDSDGLYVDSYGWTWKNAEPAWGLIWTLLNPPQWVEWCAMDEDGGWYFFEKEPQIVIYNFSSADRADRLKEFSFISYPNWKESKMKRPERNK